MTLEDLITQLDAQNVPREDWRRLELESNGWTVKDVGHAPGTGTIPLTTGESEPVASCDYCEEKREDIADLENGLDARKSDLSEASYKIELLEQELEDAHQKRIDLETEIQELKEALQ